MGFRQVSRQNVRKLQLVVSEGPAGIIISSELSRNLMEPPSLRRIRTVVLTTSGELKREYAASQDVAPAVSTVAGWKQRALLLWLPVTNLAGARADRAGGTS